MRSARQRSVGVRSGDGGAEGRGHRSRPGPRDRRRAGPGRPRGLTFGPGRRAPAPPAVRGPVTTLPQLVDLLLRKINILQRVVKEFSVTVGDATFAIADPRDPHVSRGSTVLHPAPPSRPLKLRGLSRLLLAGATSITLATAGLAGVAVLAATPAFAATATGGNGASLPYTEVLAQNSPTTGTVIGPSYTQGQLADEAVGRKAVTLAGSGSGQSVTFTTPVTTNSIDFRYSIPDSSDGSVYTAPLSLYINGVKQSDFTLTNAYSWYYGSYPFVNTPGSGTPMHFFDEVHRLFSTTYPAGTTFKLEVDSEDTASSYTINLADFENVAAPLAQPSGSVSVVSEGADPTGVNDSTNAFNAAITAAGSGGTVWIPAGTYNIPGHIIVNNVTVEGAGMWYSTVTGTAPGFYGNSAPSPSTNVHLQNFAIFGNVQIRDDSAQVNGIGGAMSNSTVSNIWIEHMKVGAWMDGPMTNLTFSGMRIRDTTADGINLHGGVTNSTVTNSNIRNTGDDGIATWADSGIGADSGDTISNNTVQLQQLANGIAIYGGNNNTVSGNLVVDTGITQGGGIHVGQRFSSTPVGLTTISNNTMIRDGDLDPNWQFGVGALWFDGSQGWGPGPINVSNALIEQSPFEAIQWVEGTITNVNLSNVSIIGTGTFALQEQTGGTATATNVTATGVAQANAGNAPSYRSRRHPRHRPARVPRRRLAPAGPPAVPGHRRQREPDGADVQSDRGRQHQRRPDGDGRQPDQRGLAGLVHHRQRSLRRDQQLRLVDRGEQLLHGQRDLLADSGRRRHRQRHHQRRRGHQHGEPVRHRHGTGPGAEPLPG